MKSIRLICATLMILGLAGVEAQAATISGHLGDNDPTTEGFDLWPWNGGITTAALPNDNGWTAWQIQNTGTPQQAVYYQSGGLTSAHIDEIQTNGFTLSLRARVIDGPTYDPTGTQQVSAAIAVAGFSNVRFDIGLGSDGLGNTLVILPSDIIEVGGSTFSYTSFGSPLLVSGNDYHLYQLSYDPTTMEASFFLDGILRWTGYAGATVSGGSVADNFGLAIGALNNATANFALAELKSGQLNIDMCEGDFDQDGDVDGSDLGVFSADFGSTNCSANPVCEGDFDNDGDVDGTDLGLFSADFGRIDCPIPNG